MAVKIITDSTSDINLEILKDLDIELLYLYVTFGDDNIKDSQISNEEFYARMEKEGIPISSQPAVGDMMEVMEKVVKAKDDLVCVFLSSEMSGTYQSGLLAKDILEDKYPEAKIAIIDSETTSMQLGLSAIEGARLAKEGADFDTVVKKVEETVVRTRFTFIPDNLDYLHKGGRIGGAETLFGNMFKITPILTVRDKNADILQTVRTKKRAKATLIKKLMEDHKDYEVKEVFIHHINTYKEAEQLQEDLRKELDIETTIADIGPVIGLHVGPGSVGLAYRTKDEIID